MGEDAKIESRKATVSCQFCLTLNRVDLARAKDRPKCGECGRPILLDRPIKTTDDDLSALIKDAEVPVLVDFHADWCAPCKVMAPVLDEIARERMGSLVVAKLDTDANPRASEQFSIRGIPTLILFRSGSEATRQTGAVKKEQVEALIDAGRP